MYLIPSKRRRASTPEPIAIVLCRIVRCKNIQMASVPGRGKEMDGLGGWESRG